jgi:hypothetical protein
MNQEFHASLIKYIIDSESDVDFDFHHFQIGLLGANAFRSRSFAHVIYFDRQKNQYPAIQELKNLILIIQEERLLEVAHNPFLELIIGRNFRSRISTILGIGMHIIQDLCNPLHLFSRHESRRITGYYETRTLHRKYEIIISNALNNGYNFNFQISHIPIFHNLIQMEKEIMTRLQNEIQQLYSEIVRKFYINRIFDFSVEHYNTIIENAIYLSIAWMYFVDKIIRAIGKPAIIRDTKYYG